MKKEKLMYQPYSGGAGPTEEQRDNNTLFLGQELTKLSIEWKKDTEYMEEAYPGSPEELMLSIERPDGEKLHVCYDRWGFVIDELFEEADQITLEYTIELIKNFLK